MIFFILAKIFQAREWSWSTTYATTPALSLDTVLIVLLNFNFIRGWVLICFLPLGSTIFRFAIENCIGCQTSEQKPLNQIKIRNREEKNEWGGG